ncbi:MAG: hypothetical protein WBY67_07405, partial [Pseudolabrys sp.]
ASSFDDQYAGHVFFKTADVPEAEKLSSQSVPCDSGKNQGRPKEKAAEGRKFNGTNALAHPERVTAIVVQNAVAR